MVGRLTGGIAHDSNDLLTIVIGNVDMARRAFGKDEGPRAVRAMDNATAFKALLGRARFPQGRYAAVLLDEELPDKPGEALAVEIRASYADMPILIAAPARGGLVAARFLSDHGLAVIGESHNAGRLRATLMEIGVTRDV